jgi:hypothetical protein
VTADRADFVIRNESSLDELERASLDVLHAIRARFGSGVVRPRALRIDLHLHTAGSFDCLSDPEAVLAAASGRGVDRIAITDHDGIEVALEMHARYPDRVIVGEEVRTAEGVDVIGLYLTELIPRGTPAEEVCRRVRDQGGIPYLPHPYAKGKGGGGRLAERLAPLVDVVEVFNGRMHPAARNAPAEELSARFGKLRGAGSDAHTLGEVGRCFVEVEWHENLPAPLLRALATARVEGTEASRLVHVASTWAKLRKRLPR